MPLLTLEQVAHPSNLLNSYAWYELNLLLPIASPIHTVTGFITNCNEFKPVISRELARMYGVEDEQTDTTLKVVFQSKFEGDLVYHRTPGFPVEFHLVDRGPHYYFQLPMSSLRTNWTFEEYTSYCGRFRFVAMRIIGIEFDCITVPLERFSDAD